MEWSWSSWLKDWWRLKHKHKIRRRSSRDGDFEDDIDANIIIDHEDVFRGDFNDAGDDDEPCQCVICMNGDLELDPSDGIDSDGSVSSNSGKQVIVGICAMSKKSQSKPMKEILTRLQDFEFIKIVIFPEETILKEAVDQWPICDCLISFHSKGFPLDKAIQYAILRKPYVINNLLMQYDIQDRRKVYSILEGEGIEIPRYAVLDRDSPDPKQHELVESEDHVEVNGVIFNKPFVEKPVSAEDHNIYIYYPTSAGGGSQRLFRKIGSRSSVYSPESRVRKTGSFIYEDFMPTDGTDVKVYTVGPDYAHAEARKSPALDGKVERDSEGKEIRYPVILSNAEKLISRKVCLAFKQTVCGFDLLRANGKSYVCDVNGFSFVKNSNKYYDDCAKILGNMILRELAPTLHIPWSVPFQLDDPPIVPTTFGKMMELRCVVAVIRHGDRTPKQKMKVEVRHPKFFEIFEKYDGYKHGHIKLKRPKQLQEILDVARSLLSDIQTKAADPEIEEKQGKLEQLKSVLEMYGHFSGINRKVQMKYQPKGRPRGSSSDDGNISSTDGPKDPSLVLILKWGGELTPAGRIQAEELGRIFRCMYPGGQGRNEYSGTQGLGLLRLHSTFRHDLKIYASDEGRVQMTAAAFAKGLLALEGELTPILVQMVKSANTNGLLDNDCDSSKYQNMAKNRLHELMQIDRDFTPQDRDAINPGNSISINQAMDFVKNPVKCCNHVQALIQSLLAVVVIKRDDPKTRDAILYHGETWELMGRRWGKIEKDFSTKSKTYDISKIPDIYDCIKYDLQHNQHTLQYEQAEELYMYAKYLADIVIPQEYGLSIQEKLAIGQGICTPLLKKIKADLQRNIEEVGDESVNRLNPRYSHGVSSPGRHVRTRLYFTSESHVHSLLTVLRYGGLANIMNDEQWRRAMEYVSMVSELNYMSQIVIMLYEDPTKDPSSEERFHVELHFSPGVNCCVQKNLPPGPGFRPHSRNDSGASKNNSGEEDGPSTRIDEESEMMFDEEFGPIQTVTQKPDSPKSPNDDLSPSEFSSTKHNKTKSKHLKSSNPISIGSHHTVSGHEAMDLAKRLTEELAAQQSSNSLGSNRAMSPDSEPRARSFEHRQHQHHHHASHHHDKAKDSPASTTSHHNNNSSSSSTSSSAVRRQRHGIAGQMNYFKLLGFGGFNKKMTTSTNSLFSTAVISGSSSAPNLRDMIPNTITSPSVLEGFGGVPPIRPLETLHNALSLKQIDTFLEKMTTAMLYKTPASSPPKNPSTPIPTPLQTPQNSLPHVRSSWSGQSSMTNSTSALSSGGPSSPNISDMYSRGCPSSDMSASLISNDGVFGFGATPELSHMFPALDYELGSVGAQLTLDQIDNRSLTDFKMESRFGHGSGDTTPVSASSDWEFNTNDATKGSTTNELCTEEEEEETTLSTDTCLSTQGDILSCSTDQLDLMNNENTIDNSFGKLSNKNMFQQMQSTAQVSTTTKAAIDYDLIKSNLKNDLHLVSAQPSTSSSASMSTSPITGTPKIDNKYRNNRIQKQISLYEKESICTTEYKNLAKDVPKFNETPSNLKLAKRRIGTVEPPNFLSAEDLEKSMTNIEKNLNSVTLENQKDKCTKTKSCVNLKMVSNPSNIQTASSMTSTQIAPTSSYNPGAVLVRESFIEPPRRVAKSFHGKTQYSNLDAKRRSNEMPESIPNTDSTLKKTNNVLSRQYSIPGTSSGYTGVGGGITNNNNSSVPNTSRFRTRLVREVSEPAPDMENFLLDQSNNSGSVSDNISSSLLTDSSTVVNQLNRQKNLEDNN